jgi:anti-sigma regulatory factor (Ser/Thr protein kinase)
MGSPRPDTLSRTYPAVPASVPEARHDVMRWLKERWEGARATKLRDVELAVSEGISNAVNHAYDDEEPGEVRVDVRPADDGLQVTIEDDGCGMLPRHDSPGVGLGLPLIATVAARFDTSTRTGAGTRLCMLFRRS